MALQELLLNTLSGMQSDQDVRHMLHNVLNYNMSQNVWNPYVDIVDLKDYVNVYVEIPGVIEESIDIGFFNNKLTISGEKINSYIKEPLRREIPYGKFNREIVLPISVTSQENVSVCYISGILKISINKLKESSNKFKLKVVKKTD